MIPAPCKGRCFLVPSGPKEDGKHLYVIITNKCEHDCYLLVSISSVEPGEYYDPACLLRGGEHPFISHLSFVAYSKAMIMPHDDIVRDINAFTFLIKTDASEEFLAKICEGTAVSKRFSPKVRRYFQANQSL